ncbi:MAG TPA: nodulation protein NfeD [Balneolaceae bacterium]|nr:nodulation protein NfeD [Balneolaceae bacterium]|tara:strand:+ start:22739 stop:23227 length:489 start_codon:yes stop_codon:yes gene_type:complete
MDGSTLTWIFLIGGIILMALEMVLPSGLSLILGFSGLIVGLIRFFGLLNDPLTASLAWIGISMVLTVGALPFIKKFFGGETSYKYADEDYEAMDQIVEAVEDINDVTNEGRIRYQGISWQARTLEGNVPAGTKVRIKYRDNTTWIVEPVDAIDQPQQERIKE